MKKRVGLLRRLWRYFLSLYYGTLHNPKKIAAYKRILNRLPLNNNKVVFENYGGLGFGENPKYIAEELLKRNRRLKMIWLTNDDLSNYPNGVRPVQRDSFRALYECATAKAWVFNTRDVKLMEKREGQIYLQTWHGGVALKKVEQDAQEKLSERYVLAAKYDGQIADGIIVDGTLNEAIFESSFWLSQKCERLRIGQPRIDVLIREQNNQELKHKVRNELGLSDHSFLVLYAPTFRKESSFEGYITDFAKVRDALEERFGKVDIALRLHPTAAQLMQQYQKQFGTSLVNATRYPDVQELVIAADCVISDYSSIAYDFAIIRKPVFLIMKDLEDYIKSRGVYDVFYDQPFEMNTSEDMLAEEIRGFSYKESRKRMDEFYEKHPTYNTGTAAEQAVNWLLAKGLCTER